MSIGSSNSHLTWRSKTNSWPDHLFDVYKLYSLEGSNVPLWGVNFSGPWAETLLLLQTTGWMSGKWVVMLTMAWQWSWEIGNKGVKINSLIEAAATTGIRGRAQKKLVRDVGMEAWRCSKWLHWLSGRKDLKKVIYCIGTALFKLLHFDLGIVSKIGINE